MILPIVLILFCLVHYTNSFTLHVSRGGIKTTSSYNEFDCTKPKTVETEGYEDFLLNCTPKEGLTLADKGFTLLVLLFYLTAYLVVRFE